ncbi:hypothetical protein LZC95_51035 [Pendulispora brunnea]|uniref:CBM-cenC domain-containing protein n=1 Tax=Pendulispora brunnea TaxID=2905690 RepID=A0ABZ2K9K1_9BACT
MKNSNITKWVSALSILAIGAGCGGGDEGAHNPPADAGIDAPLDAVAVTPDAGDGGSCGTTTELMANGGFEEGNATWTTSGRVITNMGQDGYPARAGTFKAYFGGFGYGNTGTLSQKAALPAEACKATLSYWVRVLSDEPDSAGEADTLTVQLRDANGAVLETLSKLSNRTLSGSYIQKTVDLTPYKGKTVEVRFVGIEDRQTPTSFFVDDVSLSYTH